MWNALKPHLSRARYSSSPPLWASRACLKQELESQPVIQPRAQRWAHRQPYYQRRTLCSFPRREGNYRPKLNWIYSLALVRLAPIDYSLGQRPQHNYCVYHSLYDAAHFKDKSLPTTGAALIMGQSVSHHKDGLFYKPWKGGKSVHLLKTNSVKLPWWQLS